MPGVMNGSFYQALVIVKQGKIDLAFSCYSRGRRGPMLAGGDIYVLEPTGLDENDLDDV